MSRELFHQLVLWSGRLAALAIVLNFMTCFVMPWARTKLPWRGTRPGKDNQDASGNFQFTMVHRVMAWSAIVLVAVHIVLSIVQGSLR